MKQPLAPGDPVCVADRDAASADAKSGLFYPHYRGLTGTLTKIYPDGTAAVTVDPDSLPDEIRVRHRAGSAAQRQRWLDGLSDEARNRLSAAEKQFSLRYTILVAAADLNKGDAAADAPPRKSSSDLADAEARHLEEIARKQKPVK
ncbi:MAG: hypothetical protein JO250_10665 [Armatimonadetes bacterium]|nr:hypothetical protein [Armatimonadota bacterium]